MQDQYWKHERCVECGGGFSEESWDTRHTHDRTGGDVHERCCRDPECRAARAIARKLARDLEAARALCRRFPAPEPPPPAQAGLWGRGDI